jgi:hypothetical protein
LFTSPELPGPGGRRSLPVTWPGQAEARCLRAGASAAEGETMARQLRPRHSPHSVPQRLRPERQPELRELAGRLDRRPDEVGTARWARRPVGRLCAGGVRGGGGPDAGGLAACGRGSGRLRGALGARGLRRCRLGRRARGTLWLVAAAARPPPAGALGPRAGEGRHHVAATARAGPVAGVWLLGAHLRHMIAHSARRCRRRLKRKRTGAETFRVQLLRPNGHVAGKFTPKLETDSSVTRSTSGALRIGSGGSCKRAGLCRYRR